MTISLTSPNTENYYVGKGIVYIKLPTDTDYVDVGNVTAMEFTPTVEKLDHFSSRTGIKTKDRSVVLSLAATLKVTMEEWTARNLALTLLGDVVESGGIVSIDILTNNSQSAAVKFVGANDVGPQWSFEFPSVSFTPSGTLNPISDEWGALEVTGDVNATNGVFGTATCVFPNNS
jgi:hypothetical protein